ncbi:response regulator [Nonomuraea muscovyensis]|uniref:DNA-binding NarL/FixJ family response regulator n=1 Tax=Nonomuraea muscovyensis TaxID=1124761 RepID=A0A7X0C239_9ACTN|nr:response regulator transcription factor [Nonomuraea muscovyensis]MBB6347139.1 DNA-binding NarL/FixJ family response regulator [Nonomuraea muscovyensis]MDF2708777.1 DNA-binding response regulator [Nonomuraea muscovyensis]
MTLSPTDPTGPAQPGEQRVRVLVVDDQELVREGIASLLGIQPGIVVVGTAADGQEAVEAALSLEPDVVLMDVRMPRMSGVEAVSVLRRRAPACRVVMLTTFDNDEYVVEALRAGAAGYLLKNLPAARLAEAVRLASAGVAQLDSSVTLRLAAALPSEPEPGRDAGPSPASVLTPREIEVLRLIATGSTNREIAARMYLSEGTVKNHISRILGRLGLRDRTQAAVYARDHRLL